MNNWTSFVEGTLEDWLLEEENPSVRYITLTDILGRSLDDSEVVDAKKQIMKIGVLLLIATIVVSGLGMTAGTDEIKDEKNIKCIKEIAEPLGSVEHILLLLMEEWIWEPKDMWDL